MLTQMIEIGNGNTWINGMAGKCSKSHLEFLLVPLGLQITGMAFFWP